MAQSYLSDEELDQIMEDCFECQEIKSGRAFFSHYHCPMCGEECSMVGHMSADNTYWCQEEKKKNGASD